MDMFSGFYLFLNMGCWNASEPLSRILNDKFSNKVSVKTDHSLLKIHPVTIERR